MRIRTLITAAALGLALAPSAALADDATEDLLLARDGCASTDPLPPNPHLGLGLGASTGSCGGIGTGSQTTDYPATDGVPVTVDATRPVTVAISLSSYFGVALGGVGDETVEITLTGKKSGSSSTTTLGSASMTTPAADMLRKPSYTAEFELPLTAAMGGVYKSLNLELTVGGSLMSGFVAHDGSSLVSLPVPDPIATTEG